MATPQTPAGNDFTRWVEEKSEAVDHERHKSFRLFFNKFNALLCTHLITVCPRLWRLGASPGTVWGAATSTISCHSPSWRWFQGAAGG